MHWAPFQRTLFCVVLLVVWAPVASAQNTRVHLKVSADDQMKKALQTHLEEGLKMVPDVTLSADAPDFTISVIALKVTTRSSKDMGVAVSVLITAPYESKVRGFAESRLSPDVGAQLASMTAGAVKTMAHWIEIASVGELQQVSRSIIRSFDKDVLNLERKFASHAPPRLNARAPLPRNR